MSKEFLIVCPKCGKTPKFYEMKNHYGGYKCSGLFSTHFDTGYGNCFDNLVQAKEDARIRWNKMTKDWRK